MIISDHAAPVIGSSLIGELRIGLPIMPKVSLGGIPPLAGGPAFPSASGIESLRCGGMGPGGEPEDIGCERGSPTTISSSMKGSAAYDSGNPCIFKFRRRSVMN